jgi:hypothetical protein
MALPFDIFEAVDLQDICLYNPVFSILYCVFQTRELMHYKALLSSWEMIVKININLYLIGVLFIPEVSLKFSVPVLP